ncbi:MAG: tetratricopeptide repeat protein [Acidobacteriota bacterium]
MFLFKRIGTPKPALLGILFFAAAIRFGHWWAERASPFVAELIMDSQEYDRWARTIAAGDWLGSGTFFQAPLYPYFLATVYAAFGHSLSAVYLIQIAAGVSACAALFLAGRRLGGSTYGLAAAALGAAYGPFVFYDVQLLKESLAVTATAWLLYLLIRARDVAAHRVEDGGPALGRAAVENRAAVEDRAAVEAAGTEAAGRSGRLIRSSAPWVIAGGLCGVLALLRENMLLVVPCLLILCWIRGQRVRTVVRAAGLLAGLVLVLLPVAIRNGVVGGAYLPTTFQGGTNIYIGNNPDADGTYRPIVPGKQIPVYERAEPIRLAEEALGRELSEAEVSRYWLGRSLDWAQREPLDFAALQIRKLGMFWDWYEWPDAVDYYYVRRRSPALGLAPLEFGGVVILACAGLWLRRRHLFGADLPMVLFTVGWTAATVIFFLFARYRLPVVPALLLWGAAPVARFLSAAVDRRLRPAAGWGALLVTAVALPALGAPGPRMDLTHYNLAVLHQQHGRPQAAEAHFLATLELDPGHTLASMNLGRLAVDRRDWAEAERWFRRAVDLSPDSDDARANLGGILLATGRTADADRVLREALALNGRHPGALANLASLRWREGDHGEAQDLARRLLAVDPGSRRALEILESSTGPEPSGVAPP